MRIPIGVPDRKARLGGVVSGRLLTVWVLLWNRGSEMGVGGEEDVELKEKCVCKLHSERSCLVSFLSVFLVPDHSGH